MSGLTCKSTLLGAAAVAGMALTAPAHGAVVVDWDESDHGSRGGFYDDSRLFSRSVQVMVGDFDNDGSEDDTQVLVPFSMTESLNPAFDPPSYVNAESAVFYGGQKYVYYNIQDPEGDEVSYTRRYNRNGYLQTAFSGNAKMAHALMWDKSGFLNGGSSAKVSLDETSSFYYDNEFGVNNASVRFLIGTADGEFYISQSSASGTESFSLSGQDLVDEMWASYDTGSIEFDPNTATFTTSTGSLTDITRFGVYAGDSDSSVSTFTLANFDVDAVVPEPASIGLALGGLGLMLSRRRSRA